MRKLKFLVFVAGIAVATCGFAKMWHNHRAAPTPRHIILTCPVLHNFANDTASNWLAGESVNAHHRAAAPANLLISEGMLAGRGHNVTKATMSQYRNGKFHEGVITTDLGRTVVSGKCVARLAKMKPDILPSAGRNSPYVDKDGLTKWTANLGKVMLFEKNGKLSKIGFYGN